MIAGLLSNIAALIIDKHSFYKQLSSLIDTEIAGQRTMIAFRRDLKVEKLLLRSVETGIKNVKIATLKN